MNKPKTQKELLDIIGNQEIQIDSLRKAVALLEKKITMVAGSVERVRGQNRRLTEQLHIVQHKVKQNG